MSSITIPRRTSCHSLPENTRTVFRNVPARQEAPKLLEAIGEEQGKKTRFDDALRQVRAKVDDRANSMTFGSGEEPLGRFNRKWHQVGKKARDSITQTEALAVERKRQSVTKLKAKLEQEDKLLALREEARLLSSNRLTKMGAKISNRADRLRTERSAGRLGAKAKLAVIEKLTLPAEERLLRIVTGSPERLNAKTQVKLNQATEIAKTLHNILLESLRTNQVTMSEDEARGIASLSPAKRKILMETFSEDPAKFNANWPLLFDGPNKLTAEEQELLMTWCESEVIPATMRKTYKTLTAKRGKLLSDRQVRNAMERTFLGDVREKLREGSAMIAKLGIDPARNTGTGWKERLAHLYDLHPRLAFMVCAIAQQRAGRSPVEPVLRILLEGNGYAALEKKLREDIDTRSTTSLLEAGNAIIASHEKEQERIMEELGKVDRKALNTLPTTSRIDLASHADKISVSGSLDEVAFSIIENGLIPTTINAVQRFSYAIFAAAKLKEGAADISKIDWKKDLDSAFLATL